MNFQIGESVIYPPYGIALIVNISNRYFGSEPELCYHLRIRSNSMNAIVPVNRARDVRLRKLAKPADIKRVLSFLATDNRPTCADWKTRVRENAGRVHSGDLLQVAEVFKGLSLILIDHSKTLSPGEKITLESARRLVAAEISAATSITEEAAVTLMERAVGRALRRCSGTPRPMPALKHSAAHA